jgi:hypothetical protein
LGAAVPEAKKSQGVDAFTLRWLLWTIRHLRSTSAFLAIGSFTMGVVIALLIAAHARVDHPALSLLFLFGITVFGVALRLVTSWLLEKVERRELESR